MSNKQGCSITVDMTCTDENGQVISTFPNGALYGYDRASANAIGMDIYETLGALVDKYNKARFGDDYREKALNPDSGATTGKK